MAKHKGRSATLKSMRAIHWLALVMIWILCIGTSVGTTLLVSMVIIHISEGDTDSGITKSVIALIVVTIGLGLIINLFRWLFDSISQASNQRELVELGQRVMDDMLYGTTTQQPVLKSDRSRQFS